MKNLTKTTTAVSIVAVVAAGITGFVLTTDNEASATNYLCVSERCKAAERQETAARRVAEEAASQKSAYQSEVNRISAEISEVQAQINKNEEEIAELNVRIDNTQKKIDKLRESLKATIVKLYLSNDVSEFEILASSNSVADFTTRSANQSAVQNKVKQLSIEAKEAKAELDDQKKEVENRKADNEANKSNLAAKQLEQQRFVNEWSGRESSYTAVAEKNKKIREEEQEKQRQLVVSQQGGSGYVGDASKGNYPYSGECPWNADTNAPIGGQLGYGLKCECYNYGIWKIYQHTGRLPTNLRFYSGPKQWYGLSGFAGGGTSARAKSAAITTSGTYGHVVWVEYINPDGSLHISQYNAKRWEYSEDDVSPGTYAWYLYY